MKSAVCLALIAFACSVCFSSAPAQNPGKAARKAHADRNKDGQVDGKEMKMEKNWEKTKAKVDKPWEAKADANKDGVVQPVEAKGYFRAKSVVDRPWEEKADANSDGKVDWKEVKVYHKTQMDSDGNGAVSVEERRSYWVKTKSFVNTEIEKKYDKDSDGYLNWEEGRELLKDKYTVIQTRGKAIVNTDMEAEFDANGDGVIDRAESSALMEAIK